MKNNTLIIDVRSPEEFASASNPESKNIPLNEFQNRIKELNPNDTYILCCASGGRSGMAMNMLKAQGFKNVENAGPWENTLKKA